MTFRHPARRIDVPPAWSQPRSTVTPFRYVSAGLALTAAGCEQAKKGEAPKLADSHQVPKELIGTEAKPLNQHPDMTAIEEVEWNVRASRNKTPLTQAQLEKLDELGDAMHANLPPDYQWLRNFEWVEGK